MRGDDAQMTAMRQLFSAAMTLALASMLVGQAPALYVSGIVPSPVSDAARIWSPPDAPSDAKWSAWFCYGDARFDFRDHRSWIEDWVKRHREQGLDVVVAMPEASARELAAQKPPFVVAALDFYADPGFGAVRCCLRERGAADALVCSVDAARDRMEAALTGDLARTSPGEADDLLASLLDQVCDGATADEYVAHCVRSLPHSGEARALAVLSSWWAKGDYASAQRAFEEAMQAIDGDSLALVTFADLVLRGDRVDDRIAKTLVMSLAQCAAAAPDGATTQLVYLRALLRAGQSRLAERLIERMPTVVGDDAEANLRFAETLMEAADPLPFRAVAEAAIARVAASSSRWHDRHRFAASYGILACCGASAEQRSAHLAKCLEEVEDFRGSPNNEAWSLMTDLSSMGRYDAFALALMEDLAQRDGEALDPAYRDTLALAAFRRGQLERAAQLQRVALEQGRLGSGYDERLARYEAALVLRAQIDAERSKAREERSRR
jgi:hypothetical protein